jgi:hypothetical protein
METYEHKQFIQGNKLSDKSFSEGLQKKIGLFDKMYTRLDQTLGADKRTLQKKLDLLDAELLDDMHTELEDRFANNDELDATNEDILESFYNRKQEVLLSALRKEGFTGDVRATHGNYWLERTSAIAYKYRVRKKKNVNV